MAAPAVKGLQPSKLLRLLEGEPGHKHHWTLMKSRAALLIRHVEEIMTLFGAFAFMKMETRRF